MSDYPRTRAGKDQEDLGEIVVPDPYRWLENADDEVRAWQRAQAEFADRHLSRWTHGTVLRGELERLSNKPTRTAPIIAGGRSFWVDASEDRTLLTDKVRDGHAAAPGPAEPRALGTLSTLAPGADAARIPWIAPSPDGTVLAVGVSADGGEHGTIRLIDVATASLLDSPTRLLHDSMTGGVVWLPDSSGFFYLALTTTVDEFEQQVFHFRLADGHDERQEIPLPQGSRDYTLIQISEDGEWAVAAHGLVAPVPAAVRRLGDPASVWKPFVRDVDGTVAGHIVGEAYVAWTDVGASRGRVVSIPLDSARPSDSRSWTVLRAESGCVLRSLVPFQDVFYLVESEGPWSRLKVIDGSGRRLQDVELPGDGVITGGLSPLSSLIRPRPATDFVFSFSSPTVSDGVYSHRPGQPQLQTVRSPEHELSDLVVDECSAVSNDGTEVPYTCLRRRDLPAGRPAPALLTVYGGFGLPNPPRYSEEAAVFAASGGMFVYVHSRGGRENGRAWWEGGRRRNKPRVLDDVVAVAEDLVRRGVTTSDRCAVTGRSHGGWLTAVLSLTRPDLWKATASLVPVTDLVGDLRNAYGRYAMHMEFPTDGDPDYQELLALSPYQLVESRAYPAMILCGGDDDARCPPWHVGKLGARLQAHQRGSAPVLVHVREGAGHGLGRGQTGSAGLFRDEQVEWLSFIMDQLGMTPGSTVR